MSPPEVCEFNDIAFRYMIEANGSGEVERIIFVGAIGEQDMIERYEGVMVNPRGDEDPADSFGTLFYTAELYFKVMSDIGLFDESAKDPSVTEPKTYPTIQYQKDM